jgi:hypothetical protein
VNVIRFPMRATNWEPLLTKRQLASHFQMSTRWVELRMAEGMPSELISGRRRYRLSAVNGWLGER